MLEQFREREREREKVTKWEGERSADDEPKTPLAESSTHTATDANRGVLRLEGEGAEGEGGQNVGLRMREGHALSALTNENVDEVDDCVRRFQCECARILAKLSCAGRT